MSNGNDVDLLRRAASELREKALAAILATGEEPWRFSGLGYCADRKAVTYEVRSDDAVVCEAQTEEQAVHIAGIHPGVAIMISNVLNMAADHAAGRGAVCGSCVDQLTVVARAILNLSGEPTWSE